MFSTVKEKTAERWRVRHKLKDALQLFTLVELSVQQNKTKGSRTVYYFSHDFTFASHSSLLPAFPDL